MLEMHKEFEAVRYRAAIEENLRKLKPDEREKYLLSLIQSMCLDFLCYQASVAEMYKKMAGL